MTSGQAGTQPSRGLDVGSELLTADWSSSKYRNIYDSARGSALRYGIL